MRVLVVEDEARLAENIARSLRESAGYAVDVAADGQEGLFLAESNPYDVVLLDLMLPKLDGMELLGRIRQAGQHTPVLVLTARDDKDSVVALLNAGADDYLTKPFDLGELLARTKALIRRGKGQPSPVVVIGDLELNTVNRTVQRGGKAITLTAMEYRVLEYLVAPPARRGLEDRIARASIRLQLGKIQQRDRSLYLRAAPQAEPGLVAATDPHPARAGLHAAGLISEITDMRRDSIQRRLIASVLLSQMILTAGLVVIGVLVTYWRLISTLDTSMQAHATSVAVLVRYTEDASGHVYFDNSLLPESIDPYHPDQFTVWADRTGFLTRSEDWPDGLEFQPGPSEHWNFTWAGVPYHAVRLTHVPILDREEGQPSTPRL